jgi:16S rRNA (guanine966-N2)-methyltransferase
MRVISGFLGRRVIATPRNHRTHPMSDKARGGIFGVLGDIKGLEVLDAFAGSGAIAIEAISRGAKSAQTIESDTTAQKVIEANIADLDIADRVKATKAYVNAWSTRNEAKKFDLIFADPPYDDIPYRDLKKLPVHLKDEGLLIVSMPNKLRTLTFDGLEEVQLRNYGDAKLVFYKKIS